MTDTEDREKKSGSEIVGQETPVVAAKILFINEKTLDVEALESKLRSFGYSSEVKSVASFEAFKEALKTYSPNIVMVELNLPGFDGVRALDYLKNHDLGIPMLLMSGHDAEGNNIPCEREIDRLSDSIIQILEGGGQISTEERNNDDEALTSELEQLSNEIEDRDNIGLAIIDPQNLNVLRADDAFSAMMGFPRNELKAMRSIMRLIAADDIIGFERFLFGMNRLDANGKSMTVRVIGKNGLLKQLVFTAKEYYRNDKRRIAMIAHDLLDTTGLSYGNEPHFDARLDSSCNVVFDLDERGEVRSWNEGALRMTGFRDSEILGADLTSLLKEDTNARTLTEAFVKGTANTERIELPAWISRRDGERFEAFLTLKRLFDAVGAPSGFSVRLEKKTADEILEGKLREREAQLRSLASHLQAAREEEKANIARQLHDEFSQTLTALRMDLAILGRMVAKTVSEPFGRASLLEKVSSVSEILETAIRSARDMITELRPAVLDELGLLTAIQWQVLDFENRTGINCHITRLQHGISFDPVISTTAFRILQEALDNVKRHSAATDAFISLQIIDSSLVLEITDNGIGIGAEKIKSPASIGIISIRERVHSLGGNLEVRGETGRGTTLVVSIPLSR